MDWTAFALALLGTTSIGSIFAAVVYRKQNKEIKSNEAKQSTFATQEAQINLGEMFTQKAAEMFQKMQELQEQTYQATLKNGTDNESIIKQMNAVLEEQKRIVDEQKRLAEEQKKIVEEQKRMADEQGHLVAFVNGEYQDYLRKNGFKKQ